MGLFLTTPATRALPSQVRELHDSDSLDILEQLALPPKANAYLCYALLIQGIYGGLLEHIRSAFQQGEILRDPIYWFRGVTNFVPAVYESHKSAALARSLKLVRADEMLRQLTLHSKAKEDHDTALRGGAGTGVSQIQNWFNRHARAISGLLPSHLAPILYPLASLPYYDMKNISRRLLTLPVRHHTRRDGTIFPQLTAEMTELAGRLIAYEDLWLPTPGNETVYGCPASLPYPKALRAAYGVSNPIEHLLIAMDAGAV